MAARAAIRGTVRTTRTHRSHPRAARGHSIRREVAARKADAQIADLRAQIAAIDAEAEKLTGMARLRYQVLTGQI